MERPSKAMLMAIVLVSSIALSLHLWDWLEPACANENRRIIMKAAGGVGCFEFWFNRYQGLIGNLVTAVVAAATLVWIARQLNLAERQARADEIAHLRDRSRRLEDEKATLRKLRDYLFTLQSYGQGIRRNVPNAGMKLDIAGGYREAIADIELVTANIVTNSAIDPDGQLALLRSQLLDVIDEVVCLARGNVFQLNRALTAGVTNEWLDTFEATRSKIADRVSRAEGISKELNAGLTNEMKAVLTDIGARERDAFSFVR